MDKEIIEKLKPHLAVLASEFVESGDREMTFENVDGFGRNVVMWYDELGGLRIRVTAPRATLH